MLAIVWGSELSLVSALVAEPLLWSAMDEGSWSQLAVG